MDIGWMQIASAVIMGFMVIRMIPTARHWLKHGPKGSSKEWLNASMLLAGVVLFIVVLIMLVRSS